MSTKRTLLLIRHAETDFAGTFCGQSDPPVNERGYAQIEQLIINLQRYRLEVVYSSDLQRALATAKAIAAAFVAPLLVTSNLREISFGDWENSTWQQIERRDPAYAQRWAAEFPTLSAPHGETFQAFEKRTLCEFDAIAASNQHAVVVTHAGVLRLIFTERYGLSDEQAWLRTQSHCSIFGDSIGGGDA